MSTKILVGVVILLCVSADRPADEASKKDVEKMQGDWAALSFIRDGQKIPDDDAQGLFRTVKGNEYTVFRFKESVSKGTMTVDATKKPKTVDFQAAAPAGQKNGPIKPILGIYEFEGDKLKICLGQPGRDRPTEFVSKPGSGLNIIVWEREK